MTAKDDFRYPSEPIEVVRLTVRPEWIDYNGHMNVAYYLLAFDKATDPFFDTLGIGEKSAREDRAGPFALQNQIFFLREVREGDPLRITMQLLDHDTKKVHYFLSMYHADKGYLAATLEQITVFVDLETRKTRPFTEETQMKVKALMAAHRDLPRPPQAGVPVGIRRKPGA